MKRCIVLCVGISLFKVLKFFMNETPNLQRFIDAHRSDYATALEEIKNGKKLSHWMWYIFPQIEGLGKSYTSQKYAIHSLKEAKAFLEDPYLGKNLLEICDALMQLETNNATTLMGRPDDMKLKSSMTLFAYVADENSVFLRVLEKFFCGKHDGRTKRILSSMQIVKN